METQSISGQKTIREASEDGTLIDITDLAKRHHIKHPTFLVASFWNGPLVQSHEHLVKWVDLVGKLFLFLGGQGLYGTRELGDFSILFEPNDDVGIVLVFGGPKCDFDKLFTRSTGEKLVYEM